MCSRVAPFVQQISRRVALACDYRWHVRGLMARATAVIATHDTTATDIAAAGTSTAAAAASVVTLQLSRAVRGHKAADALSRVQSKSRRS